MPKCVLNTHQRPFLFFRIYLHFIFFSYSNSARGCLSSDLTAHKLHRLFNHNCLHTILHHTSWLCICILWHPTSLSDFIRFYSTVFITEGYSVQHYRGGAGSPVVTQVGYLWPPATSTSLFHGWQKECQNSSSSGDLWPAAALAAHDPHSWVSDVVSL